MEPSRYDAAFYLLQQGVLPSGFLQGPQNSNKRHHFYRHIREKFYLQQESNNVYLMRNKKYVVCGEQEEIKEFLKNEHR